MASLTAVREQIANLLSGLDGLTVDARPIKRNPKAGNGFVTIGSLSPAPTFGVVQASITVVILLGSDHDRAEQYLEQWGPAVVAATSELDVSDVELNPESLPVGTANSPVYAMTMTLLAEVE